MSGTRHTRKSSRKHACTRKYPFSTRRAAEAARAARISQGAAPWQVDVYWCRRWCRRYHIGHLVDPRQIHRH